MNDDDKIADMLLTWEEARDCGETITAEELCRDCPELLNEVRERVRLLESAGWLRASSSTAPDPPRTLAGRYSLENLIGSGGYAQVWRAYDLQLHRHVAVKVPKPNRTLTSEQVEEVLTEARQVARLKHPNIVAVHDVVREGAGYFIVADLIEGQTLAARLGQGRMPVAEVVTLLAQVARVIDYAHAQGVIHRDLKPANIFLDRAGQPHVGDFGLARSREDLIDGSDRRGTLAYSSPEQLEGRPLDGRSDIWSLGVILYELLTGRQPFADDNPARLRQAILSGAPPALPGVSEPVATVCLRCLALKPEDRFARGNDLAVALETAVQPENSRRWLLTVGILLLGLTGVLTWAAWPTPHRGSNNAESTSPQPDKADSTPPAGLPARDDAFRVLRGHDGAVRSVVVMLDGSMVASGGEDGHVRLWPVEGGAATILEHDGAVNAVCIGQRGHTVLTGTAKGTVTLWGLPLRTDNERIGAGLWYLAPPLAGPWPVLTGCVPQPDAPWKARTFPAQVGTVKAVAISGEGRFVAWAGAEKLEIWEVGGNEPLTVARTPGETIHHFAFLNDGFLLAAFGFGAEKRLTTRTWVMVEVNDAWVAQARPAGKNLELFTDVRGFTTTADRIAVLVTQAGAVRVFMQDAKAAGLLLAGSFECPQVELKSSVILADQRAATVAQDRTLRVWLLRNQAELATLHGHSKPITAIAGCAKGDIIATSSEDGTVRLWKSP
ncbi:MAG: protein kinase [Gemmataceae bacterium]|nr:protein kinase [Gemmataceae bacterium]